MNWGSRVEGIGRVGVRIKCGIFKSPQNRSCNSITNYLRVHRANIIGPSAIQKKIGGRIKNDNYRLCTSVERAKMFVCFFFNIFKKLHAQKKKGIERRYSILISLET